MESLEEACVNIAVGYALSVMLTMIILPIFNFHVSFNDSLAISAAFTALSIARSYVLRRFYERGGIIARARRSARKPAILRRK